MGFGGKRRTTNDSKVLCLRTRRMELPFTEREGLWKDSILKTDTSVKHLRGNLMSVRNSSRQFSLQIWSLAE